MKLFKKLAAALLALTMVASMTACGSGSAGSTASVASAAAGSTADQTSQAAPAQDNTAPAEAAGSTAAGSSDVDVNAALSGKTIGYVTINSASPWSGCIDSALGQLVQDAGATYRNLDAQTDTAKVAGR